MINVGFTHHTDIDWKEGKKAHVRRKVPTRGETDYFMKDYVVYIRSSGSKTEEKYQLKGVAEGSSSRFTVVARSVGFAE